MSNQTKQKRPNYTIEFKQDAAKLVNEKGCVAKFSSSKGMPTLEARLSC